MKIKKFKDFLNESNSPTESDIREFIKEEWESARDYITNQVSLKFPIEGDIITPDKKEEVDGLITKLVEIYVKMSADKITNFEKTWVLPKDKIEVGDTVENESGEKFIVDKMGENNDFYDEEKKKYISLSSVKKVEEKS